MPKPGISGKAAHKDHPANSFLARGNGDTLMMNQFVSTKQAAELLGVEQSHIRLLLGRGKLEGMKPGGRDWLVLRSSLQNYIKTKSKRGKPPSSTPQLEQAE